MRVREKKGRRERERENEREGEREHGTAAADKP